MQVTRWGLMEQDVITLQRKRKKRIKELLALYYLSALCVFAARNRFYFDKY